MSFLNELQQLKELTSRLAESMGGVYGDPFNELAVVVAVADPKRLGRVKVEFQDGLVSDWIYVQGSNKGVLSAQYIGKTCLITKANGRSEDAFVLGFINKDSEFEVAGNPIQVPTLDEQNRSSSPPSSPGDQGLVCNKDNSGRLYIFKSEMYEDLVVCLRRNNRQESIEDKWSWKSLTNGKWVEKGVDPSSIEPITDYSEKVGLPKCDAGLEGETHEFTEDRNFRSYSIICRKVADGQFSWMPISAPPVVFKTTLPKCTEKIHGVEYVLDSGRDSELVLCLRYQGQMKWVHHRTRQPIQFESSDPPLSRNKFLQSKKPISGLSVAPSTPVGFAGKANKQVLSEFVNGIAPTSGTSTVTPRKIAETSISENLGMPFPSFLESVKSDPKGEKTKEMLSKLGESGKVISKGIEDDKVDEALDEVGKKALAESLYSLPPQDRGVYAAYGTGGALGAVDIAVAMGLAQLPLEITQKIAPLIQLATQPQAINTLLSAALGVPSSQPLNSVVSSLVSSYGNLPPDAASVVSGLVNSGGLGAVASVMGGFSSLPGFPTIPGAGSIPQLATTALQLLGAGTQLTNLLGPVGLGLGGFSALVGVNPLGMLLGGIPSLGGLFGGGSPNCPCDPVACRKTSHGADSDGNNLLSPCGNVVANSHSSYDPTGNPLDNNNNSVAKALGLVNTEVGKDLCGGNPLDLTQYISEVSRMKDMAMMFESAKYADWPEMMAEMAYTYEAIEKGFKRTDNNITGVESVERMLIDFEHRLVSSMLSGKGSFFSKTLTSIVDTSKAVLDLYNYVKGLDAIKDGGSAGVFATNSLNIVFENITKIAALGAATREEARFLSGNFIKPADKQWRKLQPSYNLVDLGDLSLGAVANPLPLTFKKCGTVFNESKVLKDSLESKTKSIAGDDTTSTPTSLINQKLPSSIFNEIGGSDNVPAVTLTGAGLEPEGPTSPLTDSLLSQPGSSGGPPQTPSLVSGFANPASEISSGLVASVPGANAPSTPRAELTQAQILENTLSQIEFDSQKASTRDPYC